MPIFEPAPIPEPRHGPLEIMLGILQRKGVSFEELDALEARLKSGDVWGTYNDIVARFPEFSIENLKNPNAYQNLLADYPELSAITPEQAQQWYSNPQSWLTQDEINLIQSGRPIGNILSQLQQGINAPGGPGNPQGSSQPTQQQRDAKAYIQNVLDLYDLGSLSGWAWDRILDGDSPEMILQSMRQQQAYKDRFSGMGIRRELGLPAISETEYISYERYAAGLMREANMPEEFWDQRQDFAMLIGNDVSLNELNSRITNSYSRVQRAPEIVRDVFGEWFGTNGASALAAFFLDPDRAGLILDKMVTQAEIGGYGRTFGLNLSAARAAEVASRGVTAQEAQRGFQTLMPEASLYDETITEIQDLTLEGEGVGATFGLDADSAEKIRRRKDERAAKFAGAGGGGVTAQGAVGLGSARR